MSAKCSAAPEAGSTCCDRVGRSIASGQDPNRLAKRYRFCVVMPECNGPTFSSFMRLSVRSRPKVLRGGLIRSEMI